MIDRERIVQWIVNRLPAWIRAELHDPAECERAWRLAFLKAWSEGRDVAPLDGVDRSKQTP